MEALQLNSSVSAALALNEAKIYELNILDDLGGKSHLFVTSQGDTEDPLNTVDLLVKNGDHTWRCLKKQSGNICFIPSTALHKSDVLHIEVSCMYECKYSLRAYVSEQYNMEIGQSVSMDFIMGTGFIVSLTVPKELNFTEVALTATI
jgi:hypothetical protein